MKNIRLGNTVAAKSERVAVFRNFEHPAMYIRGNSRKKFFDIIAINNLSPLPSIRTIDRLKPPERAKSNPTNGRSTLKPLQTLVTLITYILQSSPQRAGDDCLKNRFGSSNFLLGIHDHR